MIFCWNLAGKCYAGISSAYVLTFDATENTKKETRNPQPVLGWETDLEPSDFATLKLQFEVTQW